MESKSKIIYIVRHGETFSNKKLRTPSLSDCLTADGRRQIEKVTEYFINNNINLDIIVSSSLRRAIESTSIFTKNYSHINTVYLSMFNERLFNPMEEYDYFLSRAVQAKEYLLDLKANTIMVCSHASFIKCMVFSFSGFYLDEYNFNYINSGTGIKNGGIIRLVIKNGLLTSVKDLNNSVYIK